MLVLIPGGVEVSESGRRRIAYRLIRTGGGPAPQILREAMAVRHHGDQQDDERERRGDDASLEFERLEADGGHLSVEL